MEKPPQKRMLLQWHPAFCAGFQIDLRGSREMLSFEMEHQLSRKPMEIDLLVIKKNKDYTIRKNIGRIFRGHNIIEFKGPEDYLSINDFYKVYGYACFYKADTGRENEISADDITITLVSVRYPGKLIGHLRSICGFSVKMMEEGIYYITGALFPIQIIVTSRLSEEKNLWLRNLTNRLEGTDSARKLIEEYGKHTEDHLYQAAMDIIVRANQETFQEASGMLCDALNELMKDKIQKELDEAEKRGVQKGMQEGIQKGMQKGIQQEEETGIKILIECCRELMLTWKQTMDKVTLKYALPVGKAEEYMERYW